MKALLLYPDRDFDPKQAPPWNAPALMQDLELDTLLGAMAGDDEFLRDVAQRVILHAPDEDLETIGYRQAILEDCLRNPSVVRSLYDVAVAGLESKRKGYWGFLSNFPSAVLRGSIELLQGYSGFLRTLRQTAEAQAAAFTSPGFTNLFAMLRRELDEPYLARIQAHLNELKFAHGVRVSAELGPGNAGANYVLRLPPPNQRPWLDRLLGRAAPAHTFRIAERDEAGARALTELQDRGIHLAANALAQSADHIFGFFAMLRAELAFYVGALNLHERLQRLGAPTALPRPLPAHERHHAAEGLYDVCLALSMERAVVGNALAADGKSLVLITGANQGGKSSFLRAVGLAQLMMQCGLFVGAESFAAGICSALATHYKREEDATLASGKLDEELDRMSQLADHLRPDALVLFNESFAATNEREGSEIARQVVRALLDKRVKMFFVTHMFDFAHSVHALRRDDVLFLRADRQRDGTRTFKLVEGEPLATSYGQDLYRRIFESDAAAAATPA